MDSLKSDVGAGRPLLLLVAQKGVGKTELLSRLANDLYDSVRSFFLQADDWGSPSMRQSALAVMLSDKLAPAEMLDTLAKFARRQRRAGKRLVLIVDDADKLDDRSLGSILQIVELSNRSTKLVQVLLSGQPEFRTRLASLVPASLRSAETWSYELAALSTSEATEYISNRLRTAGAFDPDIFSPAACITIADITGGVPAAINSLCEQALETVRRDKMTIDHSLIARLAKEERRAAGPSKSRVSRNLLRLSHPHNSVELRRTGLALLNMLTNRYVIGMAGAGLSATIFILAITALRNHSPSRTSTILLPHFASDSKARRPASLITSQQDQQLGNLDAMRSEKPLSPARILKGPPVVGDASSRHPMAALHEPSGLTLASAASRSAMHDGVELMRKGAYDDALRILHAALGADPANPALRNAIAQTVSAREAEQSVLRDQGTENPKPRSESQSSNPVVIPNEPGHSAANASQLASKNQVRESLAVVHAADRLRIGRKLLASGDYDAAIKILEAGLVTDPGRNELRDEIAHAYRAKATEQRVLDASRDVTKP